MRRKLIAANWKSNGNRSFVQQYSDALRGKKAEIPSSVDVVICPPVIHVEALRESLGGLEVELGAQDVSPFGEGAYTGELSAKMLRELGITHVIVGHSERRGLLGESDQLVAAKIVRALEAGLKPILCIGETLEQRHQGQTLSVCRRQVENAIGSLSTEQVSQVTLAYEPVWAIGTGETASPAQVGEVHQSLRSWLRNNFGDVAEVVRILYGGSVKAANAQELFAIPDVDGGLIGGASLVVDEFVAICKAGHEAGCQN